MAKRVKAEFVQTGGPLEQWGWEWLADAIASNNRAEVDVVNYGYDVSNYGLATDEPFRIADFDTVCEFLEEPTGHSVPTYESGSGMSAETYWERFLQDAGEQIGDWAVQQGYVEGLDAREAEAAWDVLTDALTTADASEAWWVEEFGKEPFGQVERFRRLRGV